MTENQQQSGLRIIGEALDFHKESVAIHIEAAEIQLLFKNFKAANFEVELDSSRVNSTF